MVHGCVRDVITKNLANRRKKERKIETRWLARYTTKLWRRNVRRRLAHACEFACPTFRDDVPILIDFRAGTAERERRTRIGQPAKRIYNGIRGNFRKFPPNDSVDDIFAIMEGKSWFSRTRGARWNFQDTDGMSINFGYLGNLRTDDEKKGNENWKILINLLEIC